MNNNPTGILLAAGLSRRFGYNKLLQPLADGTPVIIASANNLCAALPGSLAVINPSLPPHIIEQLEKIGMQILVNEQAETGMGHSIACGVRARAESAGWIIALGDMPYIQPATIRRLESRLMDGGGIIAPLYQQQRGHPVGFSARYRDELLQLSGDIGARYVIARHHTDLALIEVEDRGVISDIDVAADLRSA